MGDTDNVKIFIEKKEIKELLKELNGKAENLQLNRNSKFDELFDRVSNMEGFCDVIRKSCREIKRELIRLHGDINKVKDDFKSLNIEFIN